MSTFDPNTAATKWQHRAQASGAAFAHGVQSTNKDWQALATNAIPAMVAGFQRAQADGRIAAGISRVSTAQWKQMTAAKQGNYTTGVATPTALSRYTAAAQRNNQYQQAADTAVAGMDRSTPAARIQYGAAYLTAVNRAAVAAGHGRQ